MALTINDSTLVSKYNGVKSYLDYYNTLGKPLVEEYSKDLDSKVNDVKNYLDNIRKFDLDFDILSLQKIVIDLSSTIYYTTSRLEQVNLLADMSKVSYKDRYNEAYTSKQGAMKLEDRKYTAEQLRALADQEAIEEELINFIYTHAAAVLKSKIDAANELLKAVSKSLSAQIQTMQSFNYGQKHNG